MKNKIKGDREKNSEKTRPFTEEGKTEEQTKSKTTLELITQKKEVRQYKKTYEKEKILLNKRNIHQTRTLGN